MVFENVLDTRFPTLQLGPKAVGDGEPEVEFLCK
jgi:hypothetical protein